MAPGCVFAPISASIALFETAGFAVSGRLPCMTGRHGVERDRAILGRRVA
jgi:L-amino acid N-acyltransferase YncA